MTPDNTSMYGRQTNDSHSHIPTIETSGQPPLGAQKHEYAQIAAEAVESAGAQGLFWQMHDYLMVHSELDEGSLMDYAEEIGLDVDRFESDLADHVFRQRVQEDIAGGIESGVTDTPTFFMNGIRYSGRLVEDDMLEAIEDIAEEIEDEQ